MKLWRAVFVILMLTGGVAVAADTASQADAHSAAAAPRPVISERQRLQLQAAIAAKRRAIIAGGALLAAGALIDYALIYPSEADLDPYDLQGQLALISPQLLAFGLRSAGPSMAVMRTSEVAEMLRRSTGGAAPQNWSWWLYYGGWGLYVASLGCRAASSLDSSINWAGWGTAMRVTSDAVRAAACIYAWYYLRVVGHSADAAAGPPKLSLLPVVHTNGAAGAALLVRF